MGREGLNKAASRDFLEIPLFGNDLFFFETTSRSTKMCSAKSNICSCCHYYMVTEFTSFTIKLVLNESKWVGMAANLPRHWQVSYQHNGDYHVFIKLFLIDSFVILQKEALSDL